MKLSDAMSRIAVDINNLTLQDLKKYARPIFGAANKRLSRIRAEKDTTYSPAEEYVTTELGIDTFSAGGKELSKLRKEVKDAYNFLNKKTSTLAGTRENTQKMIGLIGGRDDLTRDELKTFWEAYNRFADTYPTVIHNMTSSRFIKMLYNVSDNGTVDKDELFERAKKLAEDEGEIIPLPD